MSCVTQLKEDSWKHVSSFFWALPEVLFPFADFAVYPFTYINHSHSSDYMLNPGSASSGIKFEGGLKDPYHTNLIIILANLYMTLICSKALCKNVMHMNSFIPHSDFSMWILLLTSPFELGGNQGTEKELVYPW